MKDKKTKKEDENMGDLSGKRLLSREEFFKYIGLGKTRGMEWAKRPEPYEDMGDAYSLTAL